ncbi:sigma factor-like helix-turn-helix DNA-binding protein, partial [Nocardia neocaledoniensis]|uniref:sigma factor-like helix-turn-helix DNA-binding protein n=1 Tax=Nocardia neocaledoniensis TaxID=236511 RepID=UPI0028045CE8
MTAVRSDARHRARRSQNLVGRHRMVGSDHANEERTMADTPDPATAAFLAHRNLLFTVAYEMLGSAADAEDVAADVELAESVSLAMLLVLETLAPTERAVFVLREVFDLPYGEIADAVGKTPAAVRQIAHRARAHVAARR